MKKIVSLFLVLSLILSGLSLNFVSAASVSANTLTIYNFSTYELPKEVLDKFNKNNPDIKTEVLDIDDVNEMKAILSDISKKKLESDLFIFSIKSPVDANLLATEGYFEELNSYFSKDKTYNAKNYYKASVNSGSFSGKKYIVSFKFYMPAFIVNKKELEKQSINLSGNESYKDFTDAVSSSIQSLFSDKNKTALFESTEEFERIGSYMRAGAVDFYNYENETFNIENEDFKNILEFGNSVYSRIFSNISSEYYKKYEEDSPKELLANASFTYGLSDGASMIKSYREDYPSDVLLYTLPMYNNPNKYSISASLFGSVSKNSKNKDASYSFLRLMMDSDYQENASLSTYSVNRNINENHINLTLKNENKEYAKSVRKILNNIEKCYIPSLSMDKILIKVIKQYYKGDLSYDECMQQMKPFLIGYKDYVSLLPDVTGLKEDTRAHLIRTDVYPGYIYSNPKYESSFAFRMHMPKNYNPKNKYPVYIYFHGSDAVGTDNNLQISSYSTVFADRLIEERDDCIIIVPQMPYWQDNDNYTECFHSLITDELMQKYSIDKSRIYLSGFSLGGETVSGQLYLYPNFYAAAIIGAPAQWRYKLDKNFSERTKDTPIWIAHGDLDPLLEPEKTANFVEFFKAAGGEIVFSKYADVDHTLLPKNLFNEEKLVDWLYSKTNKIN